MNVGIAANEMQIIFIQTQIFAAFEIDAVYYSVFRFRYNTGFRFFSAKSNIGLEMLKYVFGLPAYNQQLLLPFSNKLLSVSMLLNKFENFAF